MFLRKHPTKSVTKWPHHSEGPQIVLISCLDVPPKVRNETLTTSLEAYGKVFEVFVATHENHPIMRTGELGEDRTEGA